MKKWYFWLSLAVLVGIGTALIFNQRTFAKESICGQEPCPLLPNCCQ